MYKRVLTRQMYKNVCVLNQTRQAFHFTKAKLRGESPTKNIATEGGCIDGVEKELKGGHII